MTTPTPQLETPVETPAAMVSRRFLAMFAGTLLVGLGGVAAFNWAIDPFRVYRHGLLTELDPHKLDVARIMKGAMIRSNDAEVVMLGSSRANRSLDPDHPAWNGTRVLNAALGGVRMGELANGLRLAASQPETRRVVLFVDFYVTSAPIVGHHDYNLSAFNPDLTGPERHAITLTSRHAIGASLAVRDRQREGRRHNTWPINGYRKMGQPTRKQDHRALFDLMLRDSLRLVWMYGGYVWDERSMPLLRRAIKRHAREDLEITLAILPVHAEQLATLHAARLWPAFERFKREMASLADDTGLELWDFARYHPVTTELAPTESPPEARRTPMTSWWESSHSTGATGGLVIERLTGADNGFGLRLTRANVEADLEAQRERRNAWLAKNRWAVANIRRLIESVPERELPNPLRAARRNQREADR
ncbi:MAG: hypothetical protein AAGK04_11205 [Planctomycetota bacterium]